MSSWMLAQWIMLVLAAPAAGYFLRAWRQGRTQLAYGILLFFGYIWAAGQHLENCIFLYRPDEEMYRSALYLCYLGMCALGPACVYLAWCYSGKHRLYRDKGKVGLLFGIGAFFYLAILTNDLHHLYYTHFKLAGRGYSLLFYPFTLLSYICFVYAYVTMQRSKWDVEHRSTPLFLLCFAPPVLANTWGMITPNPAWDFTPLAYCLMVLGAYLIVWRHRPVSLAPIAAKNILDNMGHPVRVENADGAEAYSNSVKPAENRAYRPVRTPLEDGNTLVMQTDVTEYRTLQAELEKQQARLEQARELLAEQAEELERQAVTAAGFAAEQQRIEITSRLDSEVRGKLETLRDHTAAGLEAPSPEALMVGREMAAETLELVRAIVRDIKRRPGDGL